ncbi:MAG: 16S rRNA (cytidine(1402)-2'-O)-methyltransferase [Nitrospirota bacterium]
MTRGTLYIVATPIGNLEDITLRALRILKEVDVVAAEDTRHSLKLLSHYGISKPMISYWSEREKIKATHILDKLRSGFSVALISDAGTPGISDPGAVVIRGAIEEGIPVVPIPGPSAAIAALSVSGLPTEEFTFIGFLPPKAGQRRKKLAALKHEQRTLICYEAPHRILETLGDMQAIFGSRQAVLAKEITKLHEEMLRGSLSEILDMLVSRTIAGEYVLIVEGVGKEDISIDEALEEVRVLMKKGKGRKDAVKIVAEEYGFSRKELYDKSLGG